MNPALDAARRLALEAARSGSLRQHMIRDDINDKNGRPRAGVCIDGKYYQSVKEAAMILGLTKSGIYTMIRRGQAFYA